MKKLLGSTAVVLILAIAAGALTGYGVRLLEGDAVIVAREVLMSLKKATGQVIFFMVPLLIFACVTPSITRLSGNVTRLLVFTMVLAYLSSIGAAFFSMAVSRVAVPLFHFGSQADVIALPKEPLVNLSFPTIDTMSALLFAVLVGLGVVWTNYRGAA
ncbi:MAG: dicarboxylate/amino acid:cation symporter, partial [Muribaculaceae bacterium]|nr:dicarboxylate/amino acid:cation symporter [Muribaculaceae bacterium]